MLCSKDFTALLCANLANKGLINLDNHAITGFTFKKDERGQVCEVQISFELFRGADSVIFTELE